eukprot:TRINITY_DN24485_c0_g1_i1.p1 TRINITY_DN24485_c0_g1~~TRINITY_DN24485_c0_g1_i1.p1  ORF type:complete len:184 (+),score=13.50 TRINITY_DN24485_c0_g1_i1:102-653(+)
MGGRANGGWRKLQEEVNLNIASIPVDVSKNSRNDDEENTFCPDFVIILGALLCALIVALALNYLVRWAVAFARLLILRSSETPPATSAVPASSSPAPSPATAGKDKDKDSMMVMRESVASQEENECAICLVEFEDGDKVCFLPNCGHCFHKHCISQWIACQASCPTCRAPSAPHLQAKEKMND